jgi:hypothetical protein
MMLRHVQAVDAGGIGGFGKGEPLVEQRGERAAAVLHVIEQTDFHDAVITPV